MILLTNILTGFAADKAKPIDLRGLTLPGRGGLRENLRPHTNPAEFSIPQDVLEDMQVGNLSLTPLFSCCGYIRSTSFFVVISYF